MMAIGSHIFVGFSFRLHCHLKLNRGGSFSHFLVKTCLSGLPNILEIGAAAL
jgi:hypothetical protein